MAGDAHEPTAAAAGGPQADPAAAAAEAACALAARLEASPDDRDLRLALAVALGDAGHPGGALRIMRLLADHLAHAGRPLEALVVLHHGLAHAPGDAGLRATLGTLCGAAAAGPAPPARPGSHPGAPPAAAALAQLQGMARLEAAAAIGCARLPHTGAGGPGAALPLLADLDEGTAAALLPALAHGRAAAGTTLRRAGEAATAMLLVVTGEVDVVTSSGAAAGRAGPGATFDEMALLEPGAHRATVVAATAVTTLSVARDAVAALAPSQPRLAHGLVAFCRKRLLAARLSSSPLFSCFDAAARAELVAHFGGIAFAAGEPLARQGERGAGLYVLVSGQVEVRRDDATAVAAVLGPGDVIGESDLLALPGAPATAVARGRVGALLLPTAHFAGVVERHAHVRPYLAGLAIPQGAIGLAPAAAEEIGGDALTAL